MHVAKAVIGLEFAASLGGTVVCLMQGYCKT